MQRDAFVGSTRNVAAGVAAALLLFAIGIGAFQLAAVLRPVPTVLLLTQAGIVGLLAWGASLVVPRARQIATRYLFPGSYNYEERVRQLALRASYDVSLWDANVLLKQLGNLVGAHVALVDREGDAALIVELPARTMHQFLLFGEKENGDPWTSHDRQLLEWFARCVAVSLSLARERQLEVRRLRQTEEQLTRMTKEATELRSQLETRDHEHTARLDELAHDLKNPIVHIANALELSGLEDPSVSAESSFRKVRAEVDWMIKFVDHMLELARAEAGRTTLQKQLVYLDEVVDDAIEALAEFASRQDRRVERQSSGQLVDVATMADDGLVYKLFELLISRAIRLSPTTVQCRISTSLDGKLAYVDILVDRVPELAGIEPHELLGRLSRQWMHRDDRQFGITGLELSIAQWIMQAHNGSLTVAESDEQRTVIRTAFPLSASFQQDDAKKISGQSVAPVLN
ncbi:MAG: hypothetical protein U0514_00260 [Candidatus Andersenbacteria bacterium]